MSNLAVPSSFTQFCLGHTSEKCTHAFYQFSKLFTGHRRYWKVTSEAHNESALSCFLPPLSHSQGRVDFKSKAGSGDGASPPILPNICENIAYWFGCVCFSLRLSFLCVSKTMCKETTLGSWVSTVTSISVLLLFSFCFLRAKSCSCHASTLFLTFVFCLVMDQTRVDCLRDHWCREVDCSCLPHMAYLVEHHFIYLGTSEEEGFSNLKLDF